MQRVQVKGKRWVCCVAHRGIDSFICTIQTVHRWTHQFQESITQIFKVTWERPMVFCAKPTWILTQTSADTHRRMKNTYKQAPHEHTCTYAHSNLCSCSVPPSHTTTFVLSYFYLYRTHTTFIQRILIHARTFFHFRLAQAPEQSTLLFLSLSIASLPFSSWRHLIFYLLS